MLTVIGATTSKCQNLIRNFHVAGDTAIAENDQNWPVPRTVTTSKARLARAAPSRQRTQGYGA